MGEEVVHDRTLVTLGEGGEGATLPLLQLVEDGLGARRTSHRCPRGLDVCARCRACLTLDVRDGGGRCSGSPKPSGGMIVIAASLLAAVYLAITVELHIVRTATAHRASTHNTQRQEECMILAMLAYVYVKR